MALFSKAQEMAAALVGELKLIIKPTASKVKEPKAPKMVTKAPKQAEATTNGKLKPIAKASTVQTPSNEKAGPEQGAGGANQSAKKREAVQPLTYSGPVKIPEPLPLDLLADEETETAEAVAGDEASVLITPEPAAKIVTNVIAVEDKITTKQEKTAAPDAKPEPEKRPETKVEPKAENPGKPPEAKAADAKKAPEGDNMFASLFGKMEQEEETPLDRLMKSLPELTMEEVQSEAAEVQRLMNDWAQSQTQR